MKASNLLASASIIASVGAVTSLLLVNESAFLILATASAIMLWGALSLDREKI